MQKLLSLSFSIAMFLAAPLSAQGPVPAIGAFRFSVGADGNTFQVPYDANRSLSVASTQVQRAVVLLHGSSRSSANAYETLLEAADVAGASNATILLVAPQFLIEADLDFHQLAADHLFWSDSGWKEGNASQSTVANPRPASLSSFAVMDSILYRIGSQNPNLQTLVLAGHSAGSQYIHRFAAGSTVEDALMTQFGVEVVYVVANPSSYLYFNPERVVQGDLNQFATPTSGSCPDYNDYKYGLLARNNYMSRLTASQIVNRFPQHQVTYLLGELDNDPAAAELDTSCAAMLQGSHRLERGRVFDNYLRHFFGASISNNQRTLVVPGVGHSAEVMFRSPCGVAHLFEAGACDPVDVAPDAIDGTPRLLLRQGHPNPFMSETTILYAVPDDRRRTTLQVFDIRGRVVRTLHDGPQLERLGAVVWDGRSNDGGRVPAGIYFCRLQHGEETLTSKVSLLR